MNADIDDSDDWFRMPFPPQPYSAAETEPEKHPMAQPQLPTQPFATKIYAPQPYSADEDGATHPHRLGSSYGVTLP